MRAAPPSSNVLGCQTRFHLVKHSRLNDFIFSLNYFLSYFVSLVRSFFGGEDFAAFQTGERAQQDLDGIWSGETEPKRTADPAR
jgi:hypothetical protein